MAIFLFTSSTQSNIYNLSVVYLPTCKLLHCSVDLVVYKDLWVCVHSLQVLNKFLETVFEELVAEPIKQIKEFVILYAHYTITEVDLLYLGFPMDSFAHLPNEIIDSLLSKSRKSIPETERIKQKPNQKKILLVW